MKISLLFTLLSKSHEKEESIKEDLKIETIKLIQLIKKQYKDKKYNIMKMVTGLHSNSNRFHTHIGHILEYPEKEHVKNWDKKDVISSIRKACPDGYDFKVSYYLENDPKYDEEFGLCYCLKEYENYEQIDFKMENENVTENELEELRMYGHKKYKQVQSENERNDRRKQQSENESEDMEQFLFTCILNYDYNYCVENDLPRDKQRFRLLYVKDQYKQIKIWILEYFRRKAEKSGKPIIKSFKAINIRDYAVNFLTGYEWTNLEELADFLN